MAYQFQGLRFSNANKVAKASFARGQGYGCLAGGVGGVAATVAITMTRL